MWVSGDRCVQTGPTLRAHGDFEGSLWILGSGPKSMLPEAEIRASILTVWPPIAGVSASVLYGAPDDLAAAVRVPTSQLPRTQPTSQQVSTVSCRIDYCLNRWLNTRFVTKPLRVTGNSNYMNCAPPGRGPGAPQIGLKGDLARPLDQNLLVRSHVGSHDFCSISSAEG